VVELVHAAKPQDKIETGGQKSGRKNQCKKVNVKPRKYLRQ
jgi:hypothetical protein